jgi:RNA polymerase sigma-70 factor (ECF subfamily)
MKFVGDLDEAKNITHEAFIGLWEKFDQLPGDTNYRGYLYTSVRNKSLNHIRDRRKIVALEKANEEVHNDGINILETKELEREIEMAINSLPEKCRKVFELSRIEGLRYSQIADEMDISIKTVEAHMSKALSILKAPLGKFLSIIFLNLLM